MRAKLFFAGVQFRANFGGQAPVHEGDPLGVVFGVWPAAKITYRPLRLCAAFGALRGLTAAA